MYGGPPMPGGGGGGGGQYPTPLGPPRGPALGFDNLASQPPMGTPGVSTLLQETKATPWQKLLVAMILSQKFLNWKQA